ncbi:unnamed protein product [Pocillopora meandrina]|uniref:Uncharacterized protein n=1 Tax=Pocillopora meandrina TaxID=46732 RepID=A0AAU9VWR6_9CNID|nr:unnamed protein product [Pocillopora meandrina]
MLRKGKKKPAEPEVKENKPYLEEEYVKSFIREISEVRELVPLPPSIDLNEWLASNTLAFFNQIDLLYGSVSERCTTTTCPTMSAPGSVTYFWHDDKGKKITKTNVSAPQYIDLVLTCSHKYLHDDAVFPTKYGLTFPATFLTTVRKIFKLLFHVLAHMYYAHFNNLLNHGLQSHINTVLMNFFLYHQEFNLLDPKETAPLDDLLQAMGLINQS